MPVPPAADADPTADPAAAGRFRLLLVPGVVPASWVRTWRERLPDVRLELVHGPAADAGPTLVAGGADAALLRLPVDRDVLSAIPLYVETTVVVLPKDNLLTALDELTPEDLAEETLLTPADDVLGWDDPPGEPSALPTPATTEEAVALVASGVGVLVVPQSLARLHHRKDLTYRPLSGAPTSQAALAWLGARDGDPLVEELIGIVRGRTANSSRGRGAAGAGEAAGGKASRAADQQARGRGERPARTGRTGGRPAGQRGGGRSGAAGRRPRGR